MGRLKFYRSPSTLKRSTRRLINYLHKVVKSIKNESGSSLHDYNDTKHVSDTFLTSTPVRLKIACRECQEECAAKYHLEIHKKQIDEYGHRQAAPST